MPASFSEATINGVIRGLLNDTAGNIFTNAVILPYFKIEYGKLPQYIVRKGFPHLRTWIPSTVTAGLSRFITRAATPGFENMLEPVAVIDRLAGSTDDYLPVPRINDTVEFQNYLITQRFPGGKPYGWQWENEELTISGSTSNRELLIQVYQDVDAQALTAGYNLSVLADFFEYLTHRTAALLALMILRDQSRANELGGEADKIGDNIYARFIKADQNLPARQRRFRSKNKGYLVR